MPFRLSMTKRRALLLQVGVGILLFILFIGVLNSVAYTSRVPIVTSKTIYDAGETVLIWYISTSSNQPWVSRTYNIRDIAIFSNGKLYMSLPPPPSGYDVARSIRIYLNKTLADLVSLGFNRVELAFQTDIKFTNNTATTIIGVGSTEASTIYSVENIALEPLYYGPASGMNYTYAVDIDIGLFTLKASAWGPSKEAALYIGTPQTNQGMMGTYIVLDLKLYAISEKPVLKALTEPIYSFFAAVYAVLLAVIRKVKEYVVSAFGGFASQFTLAGLIGDPVVALILTMIFITVLFLVLRPRRR